MPASRRKGHIPRPRQKACSNCSAAKVRCDHLLPCTRCRVRGQESACSYPGLALVSVTYDGALSTESAQSRGHSSSRSPAMPLAAFSIGSDTAEDVSTSSSYQTTNKTSSPFMANPSTSPRNLICNIDASSISLRWLRAYIPEDGVKTKVLPPGIETYIARTLKSYAGMLIHGSGLPPFIHPSQAHRGSCSAPLSNLFALLRLLEERASNSQTLGANLVLEEMSKLYEGHAAVTDDMLLASFQAYLLYTIAILFHTKAPDAETIKLAMINLQQLASSSALTGTTTTGEVQNRRPDWKDWIAAESKRRTIYTMYLLDNYLSSKDCAPNHIAVELEGLLAPAGRSLWHASSDEEWQSSYNQGLATWQGKYLTIDELWATPPGMSEFELQSRQHRVDKWLEGADDYCYMLYAVTVCTHGG